MAGLVAQTHALYEKCFLIFYRTWAWTAIVRSFFPSSSCGFWDTRKICLSSAGQYGIADPIPIKQLSEVIGDRKLVYLASTVGGLTSGMRNVMQTVTLGLPASQVIELDDPVDLLTVCKQNRRGSSTCFTSCTTTRCAQTPASRLLASLITSPTPIDDALFSLPYTSRSEEEHRQDIRVNYMTAVINYISPAMYLAMIGVVYHLTGLVAAEREHGLSILLESMGCRKAARHLSFFLAFSTLYVVGWIVVGVAVGKTMFKARTWAQSSSQPWKQTQLAGIMSTGVCILLAIMAVV
ncbi:hypothetical protein V1522DRAFT_423129 [Lipomyces starkeyi]